MVDSFFFQAMKCFEELYKDLPDSSPGSYMTGPKTYGPRKPEYICINKEHGQNSNFFLIKTRVARSSKHKSFVKTT